MSWYPEIRDNADVPLSLHMITDTCQIDLLFQEIENYSRPDSLPTKLDTFERNIEEVSNHLSVLISKRNSMLSPLLTENDSELYSFSRFHFIQ